MYQLDLHYSWVKALNQTNNVEIAAAVPTDSTTHYTYLSWVESMIISFVIVGLHYVACLELSHNHAQCTYSQCICLNCCLMYIMYFYRMLETAKQMQRNSLWLSISDAKWTQTSDTLNKLQHTTQTIDRKKWEIWELFEKQSYFEWSLIHLLIFAELQKLRAIEFSLVKTMSNSVYFEFVGCD